MSPTSQNGFSANDRTVVSSRQVPGSDVKVSVRNGPTGDLLLELAARVDKRVENIDTIRGGVPDDWGYAERPIRGSLTELSNHASGTAIDLNATRHPLGKVGTFSKEQAREIHKILAEFDGCIRWGGDYSGRKDEMHFEINTSAARCAEVLARLSEEDDMNDADRKLLKQIADDAAAARDLARRALARAQVNSRAIVASRANDDAGFAKVRADIAALDKEDS